MLSLNSFKVEWNLKVKLSVILNRQNKYQDRGFTFGTLTLITLGLASDSSSPVSEFLESPSCPSEDPVEFFSSPLTILTSDSCTELESSFKDVELSPLISKWLFKEDQSDGGRGSGGNQFGLGFTVVVVTLIFSENSNKIYLGEQLNLNIFLFNGNDNLKR